MSAAKFCKLKKHELVAAARLFSPTVIRGLAKSTRSSLFARLFREAGLTTLVEPDCSIDCAFEIALEVMQTRYRDEYVYKDALVRKVLLGRHRLTTASLLREFRVRRSLADVVVLNGTSTVYEIKSDRDKLDRLSEQVSDYLAAFASVSVITSERLSSRACAAVPGEVGVFVLTSRHTISEVRAPFVDPGRIQPKVVLASLQRQEALLVLSHLGVEVSRVPNTRLHSHLESLFDELEPVAVHDAMVEVLRRTRSQRSVSGIVERLPASLKTAALCAGLRRADGERLLDSLRTPIREAISWA